MRIGVLALQGAFREHIMMLEAAGAEALAVRMPEQLDGCHGLVIPGGESTAISKLMVKYGFYASIAQRYATGMAVWGTCAGAILVAARIEDAATGQEPLGLLDMTVRRNAFGRQVASFETDLPIEGIDGGPYTCVFIRAPWIESVGDAVDILAMHDGHVVAARNERVLATSFHPELTGDVRVHRYFLDEVVGG